MSVLFVFLKFARLKFQMKLTSFCYIIAIYLGVHFSSGHNVETADLRKTINKFNNSLAD